MLTNTFTDKLKLAWGFHPQQEAYYQSYFESNPRLVPARVLFTSHDFCRVLIMGTEVDRRAKVRGHFYHEKRDLPVVGDWVAVELLPGDHEFLPIDEILPRKTILSRPDPSRGSQTMIANVDTVALVTSFNEDFSLRRLERGVAMIEEGRARAIILVNKKDLVSDDEAEKVMDDLRMRFSSVDYFSCSAKTSSGMADIVAQFQPGHTIAFLGMSGVGKSTLVNALIGSEQLVTSEIREDDSRGRHTTTHRELIQTSKGFWLLDSPGLRAFAVADEEGIERSFQDLSDLIGQCRFGDCSHAVEPGCAIQAALESGDVSRDRWQNYLKMRREAEFHARKRVGAYNSERKKVYAKRTMQFRKALKSKGKK